MPQAMAEVILAARLQRLEDLEAIRTLIARYGPLADAGDADAVSGLWAEDGRYAVGGMHEAVGRAAIAGFITGSVHQALMAAGCAHLLGPVAITLEGDGATAVGHSVLFEQRPEGVAVARIAANRWQLRRGGSGWEVVRRDNRLLDGSEAARALFAGA